MKYLISFSILFSFVINAKAQDSKWQLRADYYRPKGIAAFTNETVNGFHFPNNWGVSVGAERDWKRGNRSRLYQSATVGFYNDVYFERVTTLETGLGYNFRVFQGLFLGAELNTGYNHAVSSNLMSVYEGGKWVSKVDKSEKTNRFTAGLGLQIGYDLGRHFEALPLSITAGFSGQFITPFLKGTFPYFGYTQPRLGVKWRF
jgi:hypothetical protein